MLLLVVGSVLHSGTSVPIAAGQELPPTALSARADRCAETLDERTETEAEPAPNEVGTSICADSSIPTAEAALVDAAATSAEVLEVEHQDLGVRSDVLEDQRDAPTGSGETAPTPTQGGVIVLNVSTPVRPAWLHAAAPPMSTRLPVAQVTVPVAIRRSPTSEPTETTSPSATSTPSPSGTPTPTPSMTASVTPTVTMSATVTPTSTVFAVVAANRENSPTPIVTEVPKPSRAASETPVSTATIASALVQPSRVFASDDPAPVSPTESSVAGLTWVGRGSGPPAVSRDGPASSWWLTPDAPTAWEVREDPRIGLMARNMAATFEAMRKCFAGVSGPVCGFRPGNAYDAIYVRDSAYLSALTRYAYSPMHLRSVVEEVLAIQYDDDDEFLPIRDKVPRLPWPSRPGDGAISAVIDYDLRREKASVASDEEQSLVRAAYVAFRMDGGANWLRKPIRGRSVLDRLAMAMSWILEHRRNEVTGLIIRPHTTDWGDIESGDDGTWGGDAPPTVWTASIYDQAVTYRALRELAIMCSASGDAGRSRMFNSLADDLRSRSREYLWSEARGYFRTHIHVNGAPPGMRTILSPLVHEFDEDEIVSVANAIAIYAGLADDTQTARATEALERARLSSGSAVPGVSLFPAYPGGTFRSPQMAPGRYQNGAVWDWWAGTQIVAEFARGYSNQAYVHLAAMARAWSDHPDDIPEWRPVDPDSSAGIGRPAGSGHYAAAAGTMGEAVLFGLFGLEMSHDTWTITPRLGSLSGQARIKAPAEKGEGRYLVVGQRVTRESGMLLVSITYMTNHPNQGWLAIRLPSDQRPTSVRIDGQEIASSWTLSLAGSDTMLTIGAADPGRHDVEVEWRAAANP